MPTSMTFDFELMREAMLDAMRDMLAFVGVVLFASLLGVWGVWELVHGRNPLTVFDPIDGY